MTSHITLNHVTTLKGLSGRTVTLKLKTVGFELTTRAASHPKPIKSVQDITVSALQLLEKELEAVGKGYSDRMAHIKF